VSAAAVGPVDGGEVEVVGTAGAATGETDPQPANDSPAPPTTRATTTVSRRVARRPVCRRLRPHRLAIVRGHTLFEALFPCQ
jgi:hypothetical protein